METKQTKSSTRVSKCRGKPGRPIKRYWYPYESSIDAYARKLKHLENKIKKIEYEQRVIDSLGVEILDKDLDKLRNLNGKAHVLILEIKQYKDNQKLWKKLYPYEYAKYTLQKETALRVRKHKKILK